MFVMFMICIISMKWQMSGSSRARMLISFCAVFCADRIIMIIMIIITRKSNTNSSNSSTIAIIIMIVIVVMLIIIIIIVIAIAREVPQADLRIPGGRGAQGKSSGRHT